VLWEASDRVCGKRLRALVPILLPALERNGHLRLDEAIRSKVLAMSAATINIGTQRRHRRPKHLDVVRLNVPALLVLPAERLGRPEMARFAEWEHNGF
jgi:hypothetical protein